MTRPGLRSLVLPMLAYGLTPALQLPLLLLTTYLLPAAEFGVFALVQALVFVLLELSGLGTSELLIARVAVDRSQLSREWSRAVWTTVSTWPVVFTCFASAVWLGSSGLFADHATWLAAALFYGGCELLFGRLTVSIDHLSVAIGRQALGSLARAAVPAVRLVALFLLLLLGPADLATVFVVYGLGSAVASAALLTWAHRHGAQLQPFSTDLVTASGWPFAANQLLRALQGNIDRLLLGGLLPTATVGQYALASRVASTALLPTLVMLRSTYPGMFEHGARGLAPLTRYVSTAVPQALVTATMAAAAIAVFAVLAPYVLGPSYADVAPLAWWLVPLPFLSTATALLGDMLAGLKLQPLRTALVLPALVVQVAIILALAPALGAVAAILAQYAFLAALALSSLAALLLVQRRTEVA